MEGFLPSGWDLQKIDACVDDDPSTFTQPQTWWNPDFEVVPCQSFADFDTFMGHEIALTIKRSRDAGEQLALILPVGPMGMYRWTVYFLKEWGVSEAEIIRGATIYPAEWLGVDDRLGSIVPGKEADILIVDGNPVEDIAKIKSGFMVIHGGCIVKPRMTPQPRKDAK